MGFGAFSRFWSGSAGWQIDGDNDGNGYWTAQRSIITKLKEGVSGPSLVTLYGGLFLSHDRDGRIEVRLKAISGQNRHEFIQSTRVPNTGNIHLLTPIPSMELEIDFRGDRDNNDWAVEIICEGLNRPHYEKVPGVSGWFGISMMVSQ